MYIVKAYKAMACVNMAHVVMMSAYLWPVYVVMQLLYIGITIKARTIQAITR